ncbi:hypothetical protein EXE43_21295 [Halorubrum sp. SS5]|nr:hypothetical protein EXE43_21295 [Halorubrum sp. SS5]
MSKDQDHLETAAESTRKGATGLLFGLYHYVMGLSQWTKNRHIVIQAAITSVIVVLLSQIANIVGSAFFTTFWGQAVYLSGVKLRLIPIPLSLLIYVLIISFILYAYSFDSSVRDLHSEIDELKSEIDEIKEDSTESDD